MIDAIAEAPKPTRKLIPIPRTVNSTMEEPRISPAPARSCSPVFLPSSTVVPIASEAMTFVSVVMIWAPLDTAETLAASAKRPTMIRSAAPYNACSSNARNTGTAKRIST